MDIASNCKIATNVKIIPRGDKLIYINPNIPRWIVTNKVGSLILSLFDGNSSFEDIINIASESLGKEKKNQIEKFCKYILNSGLLEDIEPQKKCHKMRLSSVHLSLSDTCNLSCRYCYAKARTETGFPKLKFEEYACIINDIISINPKITFTLTGGEPLLNEDCFRIAEYIKSKKAKVWLLTNGTLITKNNIKEIAKHMDFVTISIDGPNEKIHSYTRGNNFSKVITAIDLLEKQHINYTLSMTVTKFNISTIAEMAAKFGNRLKFAPYFPVLNEASGLTITGLEYYNALKSVAGVNALSYCESSLDSSLHTQCHKCAIGDGEFSISSTGDVYPCQLLHCNEFLAGNTHKNSIIDIYNNSKIINYCSKLDVDIIDGCKDCPIKYVCGGACRARAYYEGGRIDSTSDFCKYEQEAFYDGIISIYSKNLLE